MKNKAALVFGGQGSQFTGMGKEIYDSSSKSKAIFALASEVVGYDVVKKCFEAPQDELNKTIYCQICTLAVELAIYETFKDKNVEIYATAGFSLGEYAALAAANVFDTKTAFELVHARATAMETEVKDNVGKMAAIINLNIDQIESICENIGNYEAIISNYNSYKQIVVSCTSAYFVELIESIKNLGGRAIPLKVNRPFHHPIMRPAAEKFKCKLDAIYINSPLFPVYMNVNGESLPSMDSIPRSLYEQIFKPVQWIKIVHNMMKDGISMFFEISPKSTLAPFVENIAHINVSIVDVQTVLFDY